MSLDVFRFVDAISASPATRLDLNSGVPFGLPYDGFDLSPPTLRRAVAQTLLADGGQVPAAAYDLRHLRFRLELNADTVDDSAASVQALLFEVSGYELDRPVNILQWQPVGATRPVFFRCFRSSDNRVTEIPGSGTDRYVDVTVLAEPFAYGIEEVLAPITVLGDPATAGGMYFDIATVKGDVETPLKLALTGSGGSGPGLDSVTVHLATRRRGTPANVEHVVQAEAMSLGPDTTAPSSDATMSGAGNNFARVSFNGTPGLVARLSMDYPSTPTPDARGRYRVYARVRKSVAADPITVALWINDAWPNDTVTLPATTGRVMVDLGYLNLPRGMQPPGDGYSGAPLTVAEVTIGLYAARTSGTSTLDIDYLLFVPADDQTMIVKFGSTSVKAVLDGPNEMIYHLGPSDYVISKGVTVPEQPGAGALMVSPGVTNRVYYVHQVAPGSPTTKTDDMPLIASYWPRYLYVAGPTT